MIICIKERPGHGWERSVKHVVLPDDADEQTVMAAVREVWLDHREYRLLVEQFSEFAAGFAKFVEEDERLMREIEKEQAAEAASKRSRLKLIRGDAA
jgi:hypothetical protein